MAEETAPVTVAAEAPPPASAPAEVTAPAPAAPPPVAVVEPAPAEPAAPVAAEAPVEAAATEAPAVEGPKPSLVSEAAPESGDAGEAPAPAPIAFEPFTLPNGVEIDAAGMESFTGILGNPEMTPQERGQALLDLYIANLTELRERMTQHQQQAFDRTRENWRENFESDPDIGGNRRDTTLRLCAAVRDRFASIPGVPPARAQQQRQELLDALNYTGMGDYPAFIRFLSNIGAALSEGRPRPVQPPVNGVQPQISGAQSGSRIERRYINTQGMNGNAH